MADPNANAFDSHVSATDKFSGFNADRTSQAMSQLTPLLSTASEVHANGGSPSGHDYLQSSSAAVNPMTASAHTFLSAPSPSRNTERPPMPTTHRSLDMGIMHGGHASSVPNTYSQMPQVAPDLFSPGMHAPRADFMPERVPEDSVSFLPPRVGSMPSPNMLSMVSNHSSSHSAAGGFGAPSAVDLAASAEFAAMHKGWLDIQSRSADASAPPTPGMPMGGAPWSQVRNITHPYVTHMFPLALHMLMGRHCARKFFVIMCCWMSLLCVSVSLLFVSLLYLPMDLDIFVDAASLCDSLVLSGFLFSILFGLPLALPSTVLTTFM